MILFHDGSSSTTPNKHQLQTTKTQLLIPKERSPYTHTSHPLPHVLLLLLRIRTVDLLQQQLLRLILALHHLVHRPTIEAIAMRHQLANQLEGSLVLGVADHSLHQGLQAEVVHVDVEDSVQTADRSKGLRPVQLAKIGEREVLRLHVPDILIVVRMDRLVRDVDEALRNLLPLLQSKVIVVGVVSLH